MENNKKDTILLASRGFGKSVMLTKEEPILRVKKNSKLAKSLICSPIVEIKKK